MTIKDFVYAAQINIEAASGAPFKRAHVYETLAAALGFSSLAALYVDHVIDQGGRQAAAECETHVACAIKRARELAYSEAVASVAGTVISKLVEAKGLSTYSLDHLVHQ